MASGLNTVIGVTVLGAAALAGAYFFRLMCPGQPLQVLGKGTWCPTAPLSPPEAAIYGDVQKPGTKTVLPALKDTPWLNPCPGGYVRTTAGCVCNRSAKGCKSNQCLISTPTTCACANTGIRQSCAAGHHACMGDSVGNCSCCKDAAGTVTGGGGTKSWCPGKSGNCTWDCTSAYCWTSGNQKWCGRCTGCGTNIVTGCNLARQGYLKSQCNGLTGATYNACLKSHGLLARVGSRRARITIS